ncbi:uncharacterized protein KGF55_004259 [Candida pseudojiufengensis]|uniref:uncharacterized protein n=1 Tax=Candida pseudojiufengensis TaxID=497109 RepID=UPI0022244A8F|nr:uncharacterized protein KGF55_004259 [Candida pseudojiufengensis]KAI5960992.1 hypothetical protein KGF55_004259 [Candida pseudojiufengensis]
MTKRKPLIIGDRYIPTFSSIQAYKTDSISPSHSINPHSNQASPNNSLIDNSTIYPVRVSFDSTHSSDSSSSSSITSSSSSNQYPSNAHQKIVAEALDFNRDSKVFQYNQIYTHETTQNLLSSKVDSLNSGSSSPPKKTRDQIKTILASDILQAPGLRNDYYSNLISWSQKTNKVVVGLGSKIYLWGSEGIVTQINYNIDELITSVSCSLDYWILAATANGKILLIDQREDNNVVLAEYKLDDDKCVFCFAWFGDSLHFLAGDDSGLAINSNNDEVVVGANDNCCTIWSLKDYKSPILKFILHHNAAIKALAYCPWTSSLLATGGGSKDRKIRFWHTSSGTLLKEYYTDGQITSLIWSRFKKEIVATFGFGGSTKSNLLRVYSYPDMIPTLEVNASGNLRILSACLSPDYSSICVATNDSTIRIYHIWNKSIEIKSNSSNDSRLVGAYGSEIIDLIEGITKSNPVIR